LNLELTETISGRHRAEEISKLENGIYLLFAVGVLVLGSAILFPDRLMIGILALSTIVTGWGICYIKKLKLQYEHGLKDWTLDRLECKKGDKVRITVTSLDKDEKLSPEPSIRWEIKTQDGLLIYQESASTAISINSEDSYTWLWDTSKVDSGIYRVFPRNWTRPLRRKIIVEK